MNYCWVTNLAKLITNTSVNKTTGKTPYELLLGYQPRQANNSFLSAEVYDTPHDKDLLHTRHQACLRIKERQAKQKSRYDRKQKDTPTYCTGQLVLVPKAMARVRNCYRNIVDPVK
jgi:hypothetical protein